MAIMLGIWAQLTALFSNIFTHADWHDVLDVVLVSFVIYQLMKLFIHTRADSVLKGFCVLLLLTWLSEVMQFNAMNWLMLQILNTGAVLLVVLFQPELRKGLDRIGRSRFWSVFYSVTQNEQDAKRDAEELALALGNLAKRKVGALVVLEGESGLEDVCQTGTRIDAEISAPLIENIFEPNTPLHDGAVIIRKRRIVAAACILPLSDDTSISRDLGTRHRAALGTSETTDCITLIVSEETGIISMARDGRLSRYMDHNALIKLLMNQFAPADPSSLKAVLAKRKEETRDES